MHYVIFGQFAYMYFLQSSKSYILAKKSQIFTNLETQYSFGIQMTKYYSHCGCVPTCTHRGKIVHTTFCKVHNPISQTNRVRFSPNLELKVVLEYQAQNIIHIVVVCTCACTQRGNVHATLCNEHNHISQPNQFGFSPKLEFMVLMGYQAPNIIHIVVVCSHARTQRDMIRKLLFSMCIIIYLS